MVLHGKPRLQQPARPMYYGLPETLYAHVLRSTPNPCRSAGAARNVQQGSGPYKVLKTAKVGGEGGWDYIFADADGRRLYIPRGATKAVPATDTTSEVPA